MGLMSRHISAPLYNVSSQHKTTSKYDWIGYLNESNNTEYLK